jgi:acetyl esterase
MDALLWLVDHAAHIGFDPSRVSIGGTSAGGNLAAVLAQRAFRAGLQIQHQLLLVPVMHYGCVTRACMENANLPLLGAKEVVWFHDMYGRSYLDGLHPHYNPLMYAQDCPHSVPGRAEGASAVTLAPATVITARQDTLRDDGLHYVQYLRGQCGIQVTHAELPGSHWSVYSHTGLYIQQLNAGVCGM